MYLKFFIKNLFIIHLQDVIFAKIPRLIVTKVFIIANNVNMICAKAVKKHTKNLKAENLHYLY